MKKMMLGLLAAVVLTSCANHGKKVTIEGTKGEVYYKGDGVTERDAKKLGTYLKEQAYFDNSTGKTVQIMKAKDGGYDLHFVIDQEKLKANPEAADNFILIGAAISEELYNGEPVNIFLSDQSLKDFRSMPYDKKKAMEVMTPKTPTTEAPDVDPVKAAGFDHDVAGGVNFYWKGMSDEESKTIANYIVSNGSFASANAHLYMTKEDGRFVIRFPMVESALSDPSLLAEVEKISKEIKDNVFANVPFTFHVTDKDFNTAKSWDY